MSPGIWLTVCVMTRRLELLAWCGIRPMSPCPASRRPRQSSITNCRNRWVISLGIRPVVYIMTCQRYCVARRRFRCSRLSPSRWLVYLSVMSVSISNRHRSSSIVISQHHKQPVVAYKLIMGISRSPGLSFIDSSHLTSYLFGPTAPASTHHTGFIATPTASEPSLRPARRPSRPCPSNVHSSPDALPPPQRQRHRQLSVGSQSTTPAEYYIK